MTVDAVHTLFARIAAEVAAGLVDTCLNCKTNQRRPTQRWCADCAARYMREWRRENKMAPQPCRVCGAGKTHIRLLTNRVPVEVAWLCRSHERQAA